MSSRRQALADEERAVVTAGGDLQHLAHRAEQYGIVRAPGHQIPDRQLPELGRGLHVAQVLHLIDDLAAPRTQVPVDIDVGAGGAQPGQ